MGNSCRRAGRRYAPDTSGSEGDEDAYKEGRGGSGGYAMPPMHAGEGVSGLCSGGPGIVITGGQDGSAAMWRWGARGAKSNADDDDGQEGAAAGRQTRNSKP